MARRRTLLAATLVGIAVLLPTTVWYLTASADVRRHAAELVDDARRAVVDAADHRAARLGARLEALRSHEASRPFFHYQSLYHDPRGASAGLSVTPSPLTQGTSDPFIGAHFRVTPDGTVSLPTVNERFPELSTDAGFQEFCSLLEDLRAGVPLGDGPPLEADPDTRRVVLDRSSWQQIRRAESVYATLTGRGDGDGGGFGGDSGSGPVVIQVGPLRWETLLLPSGPSLAAVRRVITPDGTELQGFTVSSTAIAEWLAGDPPTDLVPAAGGGPGPLLPVGETGWFVRARDDAAVALARAEGRDQVAQFRRVFATSALAALLAGVAVVVLVAETDRLARQRGRFAAAAAHELKTPLASLGLHSEMLADGLGDPARGRAYATQIAAEVARLGRLVSNMLDLSRLERGARLADPSPGDAATAVEATVARLRPALETEGLEVRLDVAADLPEVMLDSDALDQVLANLLDNAEKHTRGSHDRTVEVAVRARGPGVEVAVADRGPGIPRSLRHRLFRPYARAAGEAVAGLGLGLAVARALAEAMGGTLVLDDHAAVGARFVLTLPAAGPPS